MRTSVPVLVLLFSAMLAGCTRPPAPDASMSQSFVLERDLAGSTSASGSFRNRLTGAERPFTARLNGRWDGQVLTLDERFDFADGKRDHKTWRLRRVGPGLWSGTREDVVGTATGYQDGASFRLSYDADLTSQGSATVVHFEDVLTKVAPGRIANSATVSKFGVPVGDVQLTIQRR